MFRWFTFRHYVRDRSGATMVEYALILSLVSLILVASLTLLGEGLSAFFSSVAETFGSGGVDSGSPQNQSAGSN